MKARIFYSAGRSEALKWANAHLQAKGCVFAEDPSPEITHLLLDVPHKQWAQIPVLLEQLPKDITVLGGHLQQPAFDNYKCIDLLQDPIYLAENANITAHCAVKVVLQQLPVTLFRCPVLVIGWGRIGKCLAALLRQMGAQVTIAARKEADRAMALALGYDAVDTAGLSYGLVRYRVIYNTVPVPILTKDATQYCNSACIKVELASLPGMEGEDIISAGGLPSRCAPESSGELIARSILRLC